MAPARGSAPTDSASGERDENPEPSADPASESESGGWRTRVRRRAGRSSAPSPDATDAASSDEAYAEPAELGDEMAPVDRGPAPTVTPTVIGYAVLLLLALLLLVWSVSNLITTGSIKDDTAALESRTADARTLFAVAEASAEQTAGALQGQIGQAATARERTIALVVALDKVLEDFDAASQLRSADPSNPDAARDALRQSTDASLPAAAAVIEEIRAAATAIRGGAPPPPADDSGAEDGEEDES